MVGVIPVIETGLQGLVHGEGLLLTILASLIFPHFVWLVNRMFAPYTCQGFWTALLSARIAASPEAC